MKALTRAPFSARQDLGASSLAAYYGSNLDRLVAIKKKFDPAAFFNYPFSIPTVVPAG